MKRTVTATLATLAGFAVLSCWATGTRNKVEERASFDLSCAKEHLAVQEISRNTYGVRGCGKKASYVCRYREYSGTECTLDSLNGDANPAGASVDQDPF